MKALKVIYHPQGDADNFTTVQDYLDGLSSGSSLVVNVKDFGATGDGVTDDHAAIMDAVAFCKTQGSSVNEYKGATLFFPPGSYKVSDEITDGGNTAPVVSIPIVGSSKHNTHVWGAVVGYIFVKEGGGSFDKGFAGISGMRISNSTRAAGSGAVRASATINFYVRDCYLAGFTGLHMTEQSFGSVVENCEFIWRPDDYDSVGIYSGQGRVDGCSINGFGVGVQWGGSGGGSGVIGASMRGNRIENCNTAVLVGVASDGSTSGTSCAIRDMSTERCDVAVMLFAGQYVEISNVKATGTVGPPSNGSAAWAAGVATVTSETPLADKPGPDGSWTSGDRTVTIDLASNGNFNVAEVTATRTGATTFTYPLVADPGGSASILAWSFEITAGLIVDGCNQLTVLSSEFVQTIDLSSADGQSYFVGTQVNGAGGWVLPAQSAFNNDLCNITFGPHCNNPTLTMKFSNLPGQPFIIRTTPFFGERLVITDGAKSGGGAAALGDTVQGGGAQTLEVFYNGTVWKAVSLL